MNRFDPDPLPGAPDRNAPCRSEPSFRGVWGGQDGQQTLSGGQLRDIWKSGKTQ